MTKTIICYIATLTRGGAERVMAGLAGYIAGRDYTVYLVTLEREEGLYPLDKRIRQVVMTDIGPVKASEFEDCGVKYISPQKKIPRLTRGFRRYMATLGRVFYLRRFIKQTRASVILSFMGKTNLRAIMAAMRTDCRSYVSVRSAPEKEYPGAVRGLMARFLFCFADGVIFQSRGAAEFFPGRVRRRSRIIFNPLDEAFFEETAAHTGFSDQKVLSQADDSTTEDDTDVIILRDTSAARPIIRKEIITAGRLSEIKNHLLLIKAFSIFRKRHPDYTLTIYGEGECRAALESLADKLGIREYVSLPGDISDIRELRDRMRGAALFVLSSDFEGMPNAIAEAFALEIPVVATNAPSGGIRALMGDGKRGILVPVGKPGPMASAMDRMIRDEELRSRFVRSGKEFSATLHPDIIRGQWLDYITEKLWPGV